MTFSLERVRGLGFREGSGFRVQGREEGAGIGEKGSGFRV